MASWGLFWMKKRNRGRLPYYHRLDVSLKKTIDLSKYSDLEIVASATNAYDRANIFYFDRIRSSRVKPVAHHAKFGSDGYFLMVEWLNGLNGFFTYDVYAPA